MVPTLYGRQAIRLGTRCLVVSPNGDVISVVLRVQANFRSLSTSVEPHKQQIVWVLYGQASRAISIG